jgi:hypothetical protein
LTKRLKFAKLYIVYKNKIMNETYDPPHPKPELSPQEMAEGLADNARVAAEFLALTGTDQEVAEAIIHLNRAEETAARHLSGDGSVKNLEAATMSREMRERQLSVGADGNLTSEGKEIIDAFRTGVKETADDVKNGDTEWTFYRYGKEERGQKYLEHYRKLGREAEQQSELAMLEPAQQAEILRSLPENEAVESLAEIDRISLEALSDTDIQEQKGFANSRFNAAIIKLRIQQIQGEKPETDQKQHSKKMDELVAESDLWQKISAGEGITFQEKTIAEAQARELRRQAAKSEAHTPKVPEASELDTKQLETKKVLDAVLETEDQLVKEEQAKNTSTKTHVVVRRMKPMIEALQESSKDEDEFLSVVGILADRVQSLASTKYGSEGDFALDRASKEVFDHLLNDKDKKALDGALAREVQRQKEQGGGNSRTNPEVVFDSFIKQFLKLESKKRNS